MNYLLIKYFNMKPLSQNVTKKNKKNAKATTVSINPEYKEPKAEKMWFNIVLTLSQIKIAWLYASDGKAKNISCKDFPQAITNGCEITICGFTKFFNQYTTSKTYRQKTCTIFYL